MTINFTQILEWLKEICEEEPNSFASHFYSDIENFLELDEADENCLKDVCGEKFNSLAQCQTKEEVRVWLDKVCSFIVMRVDTDTILEDYFGN